MGFLDSIEGMAESQLGGQGGGSEQQRVAGGLMQALQEHPGGVQGLISSFQQNGMGEHVQQWASGQNQTATPEQVQQGLGGTGLIESTAAKAGVSPQVAQMAIATLLPMVIAHFAPGGQAAPQSQFGGMAQSLLSKVL